MRADTDTDLVERDAPEFFISGLGKIDILPAGVARLFMFVDNTRPDGVPERLIVLRLVLPTSALATMVDQLQLAGSPCKTDSPRPALDIEIFQPQNVR